MCSTRSAVRRRSALISARSGARPERAALACSLRRTSAVAIVAARFSRRRSPLHLCRVRRERSIHSQGLEKVRRIRGLGICRLHERQAWRRGAPRKVLPLPRACERSRLRFHSLRSYALNRTRVDPCDFAAPYVQPLLYASAPAICRADSGPSIFRPIAAFRPSRIRTS